MQNCSVTRDKSTRATSDDERRKLVDVHFTAEPLNAAYSGIEWRYEALGLPFIHDSVANDRTSRRMVEAGHVRGYLRKLDAQAVADAKARA